jgi:predicted O-methyltransferase YrrM
MAGGNLLLRAKQAYATAALGAGRALARVGALPAEPPDRTHRLRHWAVSLTRVHDSLAMAELDVPWWTYRAVDAIEAWLAARRRPVRVFEYGAGASTLWLARRADEVHSVEHEPAFAALLAPALERHAGVTLHIVPPVASGHPEVPSAKEGHQGLDFADYVAAIDTVAGAFDLVVIDGRARAACLARALPRLAADGVIVFDNSRRRRYRQAIAESGLAETRYHGLTPTLPYPEQTSVLTSRR